MACAENDVQGVPETCTTCGMHLRPSTAVISVTLAQATLWGSRATRMMHKLVFGEKYLTVFRRVETRVSFRHFRRHDASESRRTAASDVLVKDAPTAPQPVSPKCVMTLCLSAVQICLLESSCCGARASRPGARLGTGRNSTSSHRF